MNFIKEFLSFGRDLYSKPVHLEDLDLEALNKTGRVVQDVKEENGIITTTTTYESNDKLTSWKRIESYPRNYKDFTLVVELQDKLTEAESKQNYEQCIEIRDKLKTLKENIGDNITS